MGFDERALDKMRAAQTARNQAREQSTVQYTALERAAREAGQTLEQHLESRDFKTVGEAIKDMKRGSGGGTTPVASTSAAQAPKKEGGGWRKIFGGKKGAENGAATEAEVSAPVAAPEAAPVEDAPKPNNPIKGLDKGILARTRFTLANNSTKTEVVMVVSFKDEATMDDMMKVKKALESKVWDHDVHKQSGYEPEFVPAKQEGAKPRLHIKGDATVANLIQDMIDAQATGRIGKTPDFVATPSFQAALTMRGIRPTAALGAAAAAKA